MKITVAGAGAGKTTTLAENIIASQKEIQDKIIYCLSFTNSSVDTINEKLYEYYGEDVPLNIKVSTIHSFLFKELISPYNFFLYGAHYNSVTSISLPPEPRLKSYRLSILNAKNSLHVDQFSEKSKYLICGKSSDNKSIKERRRMILEQIKSYFGIIYIDEAQDIDKHFASILKTFNSLYIDVELIGDVKQDLKGRNEFKELSKVYSENTEYSEVSYRCPQIHLNMSNLFIDDREKQLSKSENKGELNFYHQKDIGNIEDFIANNEYDLKYIYQKKGVFITNNYSNNHALFDKLKRIYCDKKNINSLSGRDLLKISEITYKIENKMMNYNISPAEVLQGFFKYGSIDRTDFKDLEEILSKNNNTIENDKILVDSIERIKGRGENKCLFIVTQALVPYLLLEKNNDKMISHLYVGLTRSKNTLDLLFTQEVSEKNFIKIKKMFLSE